MKLERFIVCSKFRPTVTFRGLSRAYIGGIYREAISNWPFAVGFLIRFDATILEFLHLLYKLNCMKTFRIFIILSMFAIFTNCVNDDDAFVQINNESTWNLVKVEGSIAGVTHLFDSGTIQWTFNPQTETLEVINNNTDEDLFDFYDSGTYSYFVDASGTEAILFIDDIEFGVVTETQNELIIDDQVDDGFVLTLTR